MNKVENLSEYEAHVLAKIIIDTGGIRNMASLNSADMYLYDFSADQCKKFNMTLGNLYQKGWLDKDTNENNPHGIEVYGELQYLKQDCLYWSIKPEYTKMVRQLACSLYDAGWRPNVII